MKRLIALLAAAALIGGPFAMDGAALAQGRDREGNSGNREAQAREPQGRAPQMRERESQPPRAYPAQAAPREKRRVYAPPPQAYAPPPSSARRGGYLPPEASGGIVTDLGRYQLRLPPRGYVWVRVNGGFALVAQATGRIFDIVPD